MALPHPSLTLPQSEHNGFVVSKRRRQDVNACYCGCEVPCYVYPVYPASAGGVVMCIYRFVWVSLSRIVKMESSNHLGECSVILETAGCVSLNLLYN